MLASLKLAAAMIAGTLASVTPVLAADAEGRFALEGGGGTSCAKFTAARASKAPEVALFSGWVDGYFSALNQVEKDTYDITPWQTTEVTLLLLANYCKDHPTEQFGLAVNRLARALMTDRLVTFSPTTMVGSGASATAAYEEVLTRVHKVLAEKGYLKGEPAPKYTSAMKAALEKFQKDRKIAITGLPDQRTLYALFLPDPKAAAPAGK